MSELVGNVQLRNHILTTFVINPLIHIRQKAKIALVRNRKCKPVNSKLGWNNILPATFEAKLVIKFSVGSCFQQRLIFGRLFKTLYFKGNRLNICYYYLSKIIQKF